MLKELLEKFEDIFTPISGAEKQKRDAEFKALVADHVGEYNFSVNIKFDSKFFHSMYEDDVSLEKAVEYFGHSIEDEVNNMLNIFYTYGATVSPLKTTRIDK